MNFILYKITNKVNGKLYIVQTTRSINKRWYNHKYDAKNGKKTRLYHAMRKYGVDQFKIEELCRVNNIDELNELEEFTIKELDTITNGYNAACGGLNYQVSDETKRKMSDAYKLSIRKRTRKQKRSRRSKNEIKWEMQKEMEYLKKKNQIYECKIISK